MKNVSFFSKNILLNSLDKFKKTPIEVAIFAALSAPIGTYISHHHEDNRAKSVHLALAEIEENHKLAYSKGGEVGPIADYTMAMNDMLMKVFEAYNESYELGDNGQNSRFASEIYNAYDLKNIYPNNLQQLTTKLPSYIPQVREQLSNMKQISSSIREIGSIAENTYDYDTYDHYETVINTHIVQDQDGNTHIETSYDQEYDYTDHTFDYDKQQGEKLNAITDRMLSRYPNARMKEKIYLAEKTNADGEYAAIKSRQKDTKEFLNLTPEELKEISHTWYTGSTIINNASDIEEAYNILRKEINEWSDNVSTAGDASYSTNNRTDDGPIEYQNIQNIIRQSNLIEGDINEIFAVLDETEQTLPRLTKLIEEFIKIGYIENISGSEKSEEVADELLRVSKKLYKLNFDEGIDMDRYRIELVILFTFLAAIVGAGIGGIINCLTDRLHIYDNRGKRIG